MTEQKNEQQWNAEKAREERKERLEGLKDKRGGKKPIKMGSPLVRIILAVVLVVALLAGGGWYGVNSGLPQQQLSVMDVNGDKIKAVEMNYYFYMIASNYGIDFTDEIAKTEFLAGPSYTDGYETMQDYILNYAAESVQENHMLSVEAAKAGLTLEEADHTLITDFFVSIADAATQAGVSTTNYMAQYFGKGASEASLTPVFEKLLLANKFAEQKRSDFAITDDQLSAYYQAHQDEFDIVNFRSFFFAAEIAEGATDEESTKALADAKAKAEAMKTLISDEESFKAQAIANATADAKESYTNSDASLSSNIRYSDISSLIQSSWLFDATRKIGDIAVVDDTTGSSVLYFIDRSIDDQTRVNVRHILITADETTATPEEIAAAKTKAEGILAQYTAGDRTEDAFAELAKTNSEDNADAGGLYENVYPGQMVETFNNWAFDAARLPGDTGIVQTNYGFHIMYFISDSEPEWKLNIKDILLDEAYTAYVEETRTAYPFELKGLGLKFVP
ncbi:MAG: peptidylprolyl isomerase [Eubacteriales bacterium]|nr:peptidylprolyl isomerase [Eubacteriales bacterium]